MHEPTESQGDQVASVWEDPIQNDHPPGRPWRRITKVIVVLIAIVVGYNAVKWGLRRVVSSIPGVNVALGDRVELANSGVMTTLTKDLADFNTVRASHGFGVTIRQSGSFEVVIHCDETAAKYVRIAKVGQALEVGLDRKHQYRLRDVPLKAEVTMPQLAGLDFSGASRGNIDFKAVPWLAVDLSGASRIHGELQAVAVELDVSGDSRVTLTGTADSLRAEVSGSSKLHLEDFPVRNIVIKASGASRVNVQPLGRLDAAVSGASRVVYSGNPRLGEIDTSGASSVSRK